MASTTDWEGPDDPGNPQNWPLWKKLYHTIIPTSIAFLCPFGSSVYTPAVDTITERYGVSKETALLPFSLYLLGLAFGPAIAAPMSETFGRKVVYLCGLPLFAVFTLGTGFSQNIQSLVVLRFFAGLFSSPGLSIGTGTIADVWRPEQKGLPMAVFIASVQIGPAVGPVIGGFVVEEKSWRWTQWVILFGLAFTLAITLFMSETYKAAILKNKLRNKSPSLNIDGQSLRDTLLYFMRKTILRPLHMLCTESIVFLFDVYIAVTFGMLNGFFAAFSLVFREQYGFNIENIGLTFLAQAIGTAIAFAIMVAIDHYYYQPRVLASRKGKGERTIPPEERLWLAMLGAPMLPLSLFWFGWTAKPSVHWLSPVAAEIPFACGNLLIFTCAALYLTDCYGAAYGASAWSSNTFLRYMFSSAFPLFIDQMFRGLGVGWASSLMGFVTLGLMPVPFAFYIWGERLRRNSRYAPD